MISERELEQLGAFVEIVKLYQRVKWNFEVTEHNDEYSNENIGICNINSNGVKITCILNVCCVFKIKFYIHGHCFMYINLENNNHFNSLSSTLKELYANEIVNELIKMLDADDNTKVIKE